MKRKFYNYLQNLQDSITSKIEKIDGKSTFKDNNILELGCVVMKNKDEIKFNPIYKMDKQV